MMSFFLQLALSPCLMERKDSEENNDEYTEQQKLRGMGSHGHRAALLPEQSEVTR
jgi:hypothetical protein